MPAFNEPLKDRLWVLRYKLGQNPIDTGIIEARNEEYAERIGRKWCLIQGDGLRPCRFVNVKPFILADETLLSETVLAKPVQPALPNPTRA